MQDRTRRAIDESEDIEQEEVSYIIVLFIKLHNIIFCCWFWANTIIHLELPLVTFEFECYILTNIYHQVSIPPMLK